jgi:hypothetical protein
MSGPQAPVADPASWRRVVMPAEHGGWAFLGEPILLGLLVAPTWAGVLVALAAIAGFLARQPLKLFLGDRRRGRHYPRTAAAERAFAAVAVAGALALAGALLLARGAVLVPLGLAAPIAALALAADLSQRSRELAAEIAGALALAAVAAAIPLAAGHALAPALGLWGMLAARVATSVPFVRARLRLDRGQPAPVAAALAAQAAGLVAVGGLVRSGVLGGPALAAMAVLALRAAFGLSPWRPRMSIPRFGVTEVVFGLIVVALTGVGAHLGR